MKTSTKRIPLHTVILLIIGLLFTAVSAVLFGTSRFSSKAEAQTNIGLTYYYEELKNSPLAQSFYNVMTEMNDNGDFIDGKEDYDLSSVLSQSDIAAYILDGAPKIPVALGAARDAFYLDHPDLFYVDVYKLCLTVGMQGDEYVAFLGRGRADNYYNDNTVKSVAETQAAIVKYDAAINAVVDAARADSSNVVEQIKFVNKQLSETIEYSYGAYEDKHNGITYNGYVGTAYSIVEKEALCGGYSSAFKAVMDRLDIPCVLIPGSAFSGKTVTDSVTGEELQPGYEAHMWNAVEIDGLWYGVDVTWNDTANNLDKYMLVGSEFLSETHVEDPVISSSGFELKYPALRPLGYGINVDKSGFTYKDSGTIGTVQFGYSVSQNDVHSLQLGISFDGKNMLELRADGKYFAVRDKSAEGWNNWTSLPAFLDIYLESSGYDESEAEAFLNSMVADEFTIQAANYRTEQLQFAVVDRLPSEGIAYSEKEIDEHAISVSVPYSNDAYMRFIPAPYVSSVTPDEKGTIKSFEPVAVTLKYSEQLVKAEGKENEPVKISVIGKHSDVEKYTKIENIVWDESANTVSFVFSPSKQFSHNCEMYNFVPTNLVGRDSGKTPQPGGSLSFARKKVICPKVFNDGRLYMSVYGQPEFVSASDESLTDFKDGNGQPLVGDQRSQLMLVVNEPTKAESDNMEQAAKDKFDLDDSDIYASSTYQIDLQVCGVVQKVPKGSYMQVGFGFPKGYGPESAGVTFTVYHYTRKDNGEIDTVETIPCVVTPYGIIATVKSFSPFMICAVNSDKVQSSSKNILASVDGVGGTVDKLDIITLGSGSVEYTLTANDGYKLNSVTVNGIDRKNDVTADGKLSLGYDELSANNVVKVTFIADSVLAADDQNGVTRLQQPDIVVTSADMIVAYTAPETPATDGANVALIVSVVIAVAAVVIGCGVAVFFILRKKSDRQTTAAASKSTRTSAGGKSDTNSTANRSHSGGTTKKNVNASASKPKNTGNTTRKK